jgi:hypothetical protein
MKIGLAAAAIAALLVVVGIVRGNVPLNPLSIFLALLISAGTWGLVAWAIATAAADVDADVAEAEAEATAPAESNPSPTTDH